MVEQERITILRDEPPREGGRFVHYWMQQAMRADGNPALDHAVALANDLGLPVGVSFGLTGGTAEPYPDANLRHYAFLLEGLAEVARTLGERGIAFTIRDGAPDEVTLSVAREAAVLVSDRGYLRPQRTWQKHVAERVGCRMVEVETDAVVPVALAYPKHAHAAYVLRPKIEKLRGTFLGRHPAPTLRHRAPPDLLPPSSVDLSDPLAAARTRKVDRSVGPVRRFAGGLSAARANLHGFVARGLDGYKEERGEPSRLAVSHLSPYLHFGQISPVEVALAAEEARGAGAIDRAAFLEELIVRRELAQNHCWYETRYEHYEGVPEWSRKALADHAGDERPHLYDLDRLAAGDTHDPAWNTAMREMRETGYMHNRLRMYWGKKIIEWTRSPEEAFATTMTLNNRYFLDGRDANSFTNVSWLFGLHDRPWFRRPIFGTVRYLGANTLKKFDTRAYERSVEDLVARERS